MRRRAFLATVPAALLAPRPPLQSPSAERVLRLGASGDLLVQPRILRAAGARSWSEVLGALPRLTRRVDLAFANLETPLSMRREPTSGSPPILGAPPELAAALRSAGLSIVSTANNHAWDQGADGARDTFEALARAGLPSVGTGETELEASAPRVLRHGGFEVAFVAASQHVNGGPGSAERPFRVAPLRDETALEALVARARERASFVVVSLHWSHDFWPEPSSHQRELARRLVEAGADAILGHGPHVLQEVERVPSPRGEAVVAYSLGNLLSNQGMRHRHGHRPSPRAHRATVMPETRDGAWLELELRRSGDRVSVASLAAVPLFTRNNFLDIESVAAPPTDDIAIALLDEHPDAELRAARRTIIASTLGPAVTLHGVG